jgi:glycyl-tRNA synthetase (class II)
MKQMKWMAHYDTDCWDAEIALGSLSYLENLDDQEKE